MKHHRNDELTPEMARFCATRQVLRLLQAERRRALSLVAANPQRGPAILRRRESAQYLYASYDPAGVVPASGECAAVRTERTPAG